MQGHAVRRLGAAWAIATLLAAPLAAAKMRSEEVQERYRKVLGTLSADGESPALSALYELETRALDRYPTTNALERFWRLKLRVIRDLLQRGELGQLVPIIVLHHDAFTMYREREQPVLAAHSRTMAAELAETLASRSEDRQIDLFAGWVLASFGGYMQESRSISSSADFFRRALEISPGNQAALLGLGAALEKIGDYESAIPPLEKAIFVDPAFHQARLRLGLCLVRAGRPDEGREHLELVAKVTETADWIRSIAFQELARLHLAAAAPDRAEEVLKQAVEVLEDKRQPALMLAAVLELDRRPRQARAVLEEVAAEAAEQPSPRLVYDRWPFDQLEEGREAVHEMARRRLDMLAAGLRRGASTGRGR